MGKNTDTEMILILEKKKNTNKEEKEKPDGGNYRDKVKGILLVLLTVVVYITSTVCVQLLQRAIPDFELNGIRFGFGLFFVTLALIVRRKLPWISKCDLGGMLVYCVTYFLLTVAMYAAVSLIPLTYFKSIFFTFNIIGGLILFRIFLREEIHWKRVLFALLCVVGVILSIQPEFIFTWKRQQHEDNMMNIRANQSNNFRSQALNDSNNVSLNLNTEKVFHGNLSDVYLNVNLNDSKRSSLFTTVGCILTVFTGLGNSGFIILIKKLPFISDSMIEAQFYAMSFSTLMSIVCMYIFETPVLPTTWTQVLYISIHCITFVINDISLILAMRYISGNAFNIILSTVVVLTLIPQYTLLSHIMPGNKNWIEVVGSVLVFLGCTCGTVVEMMKSKE